MRGCWGEGGGVRRTRRDKVNERAVRILLECILVLEFTLLQPMVFIRFILSFTSCKLLYFQGNTWNTQFNLALQVLHTKIYKHFVQV